MRNLRCMMLVAGAFAFALLNCQAGLEWETRQISQTTDALAESVSATFHFKNTGDRAVTILEVKPACGCTAATLKKMTYAPGELGDIVAKLTIGNRQGQQNKAIKVTTDADVDPVTVLTMKTLIPPLLVIQPVFVYWKKGEAPGPRTILLAPGVEGLHVIKAQSDNPKITVVMEELDGRYRITLSPITTDDLLKARITLTTDYPRERPKIFHVFAHVK